MIIRVLISFIAYDLDVELRPDLCRNKPRAVCSTELSYMIWVKIDESQIGFYLSFEYLKLVRKEFLNFLKIIFKMVNF